MKSKYIFFIIFVFVSFTSNAINWYASPTGNGNGSINNPFNLQVALNSQSILPGDKLFLRGGTYTGRFISNLVGTSNNYITVSSFPEENAILNGNISPNTSTEGQVLHVTGSYVVYQNIELTYNNLTLRNITNSNFVYCGGIVHDSGVNCKFINLNIHDTTGVGFFSNKTTEATLIYGCLVYNNGYYSNTSSDNRGHGSGFYVQNESNTSYRILKNNIVFNNFYKGFEVWSGSTDQSEIIKNISIDDNTVFNSASPYSSGSLDKGKDNILVATENNNTINFPKNINVINNILYHNTDFTDANLNGDANSLRIGYPNSKSYNIFVDNNFTIGRNPGITINRVYNLTFTNNTVFSKYVFIDIANFNEGLININNFKFNNNKYYTRFNYADFRILGNTDYSLQSWKTAFGLDLNSNRNSWLITNNSSINNPPRTLRITRNEYNGNIFKVVVFNSSGDPNILVDFSSYGIPNGTTYNIKDVESYPVISSSGVYNNGLITFNSNLTTPSFSTPKGIDFVNSSNRTPDNFGVFLIEFSICDINKTIIASVNSGNIDNQQASNSITATNVINSNATSNYHAGSFVVLSNGFNAGIGSKFRGYIEGCSNLYVGKTSTGNLIVPDEVSSKQTNYSNNIFAVYPNPTNSIVTISSEIYLINKIIIHSIDGKEVLVKNINPNHSYEIDTSNFSNGIYILSIETKEGEVFTKKLIKN